MKCKKYVKPSTITLDLHFNIQRKKSDFQEALISFNHCIREQKP